MTKKYFFLNGMPRSGSTLLIQILNQNPRFWGTPTSGIAPLLLQTNSAWNDISELAASATAQNKISVLKGMFEGFHADIDRPVVISKSRAWCPGFELLENILGHKPKIIITYRDIPSILSSAEKLFRRELADPASTAKLGQNMETLAGRLAYWSDGAQLIGGNFNRIRDCVTRGHRKSLHFVDFDALTTHPKETLQAVYAFLGEEYFSHDFDNVAQSTHENDTAHGFTDLHTIRAAVRPIHKDFLIILGDAVKPYLGITYPFIN